MNMFTVLTRSRFPVIPRVQSDSRSIRDCPSYLAIATLALLTTGPVEAATSVKLTDVIKSNGTGNIDLFKDVNAAALEVLRSEANGKLVFGVDVNEAASGTEKASTQAVTLKSVTLTVVINGVTKKYQSTAVTDPNNCCKTETISPALAEGTSTQRSSTYYTLIGDTGSSRITAGNAIQSQFDSTLKVTVPDNLAGATSAKLDVVLLTTNTGLGDPEAFYDFSNGFEDVALLNLVDAAFIDQLAPGRNEAPLVELTNPPAVPSSPTVSSWTYIPAANKFYFAGYEDLYPDTGDYDFNDLTVAYQIGEGLDASGQLVSLKGTAYLITRGAAYSHNWRIGFGVPAGTVGTLTCTVQRAPGAPAQPCSTSNPAQTNGPVDITVFENTASLFTDPGSPFVNTVQGRPFIQGPKATFSLDLTTPIAPVSVGQPPFNAYLHVRKTGQMIQLLEVNSAFKDRNGFPFGMLMPADWQPPWERINLMDAYPGFLEFVTSQGSTSSDWYKTPKADKVLGVPISAAWAW